MDVIGLRPATAADSEFLFALHRAALGPYVTAIWGWDEDLQRDFHERGLDPEHTRIVTVDGQDAGSLTVHYRPTEIYLGRIQLLPAVQGRGVGSRLIEALLAEAAERGQEVVLEVLSVNERAYALYRRLGFREVGRHGPDNVKIDMRADPTTPAAGGL
jgi:GNAT superfamily N-acetyltransferase